MQLGIVCRPAPNHNPDVAASSRLEVLHRVIDRLRFNVVRPRLDADARSCVTGFVSPGYFPNELLR